MKENILLFFFSLQSAKYQLHSAKLETRTKRSLGLVLFLQEAQKATDAWEAAYLFQSKEKCFSCFQPEYEQ